MFSLYELIYTRSQKAEKHNFDPNKIVFLESEVVLLAQQDGDFNYFLRIFNGPVI